MNRILPEARNSLSTLNGFPAIAPLKQKIAHRLKSHIKHTLISTRK